MDPLNTRPGDISEKMILEAWSRKGGVPSAGSTSLVTRRSFASEPIGIDELEDAVRHRFSPLPCRVVATVDPFDSDPPEGLIDVDGVTLEDGDLVLCAWIAANVIYIARDGLWDYSYEDSALLGVGYHATDARASTAVVTITDGNENAGTIWQGSSHYYDRYGVFWRRLPIGAAAAVKSTTGFAAATVGAGGTPPGAIVPIFTTPATVVSDPAIEFVTGDEVRVLKPGTYRVKCSISLALPTAFAGVISLGLFRRVDTTVTLVEPLDEPFIHFPAGVADNHRLAGDALIAIAAGDYISARYYHAIGGGVNIGLNDYFFDINLARRYP